MPRIIPEARYQGGEYLGEHTVGGRLQLGIARAPHELRPERYRVQLLGRTADRHGAWRFAPCCARAASGHATAAPPSSVMNSRRFIALTPNPSITGV